MNRKTQIVDKRLRFAGMTTDLSQIAHHAALHEAENANFQAFLKDQPTEKIDELIFGLNEKISPEIDCTQCGNCCKTLMINVTEEEADKLSQHLQQSRNEFDEKFIEKGMNGMMLVNTIPCHFLKENKCTVYDYRFTGCSEFPGLHLPNFNKRLFTIFMHYDRCPIIFNAVEQLKKETGFIK